MNKIVVAVTLVAITVNAVSGYVNNFGSSTGFDTNTYGNLNSSTRTLQLNNYRTGSYETIPVTPNGLGGYSSGLRYDSNTGSSYNVEVDVFGNTTRWNY